MGGDERPLVDAPDHHVAGTLDRPPLEQVGRALEAREVDHAVAASLEGGRDREEDRVAEPPSHERHRLALGDLGGGARGAHEHDLLARLEQAAEA